MAAQHGPYKLNEWLWSANVSLVLLPTLTVAYSAHIYASFCVGLGWIERCEKLKVDAHSCPNCARPVGVWNFAYSVVSSSPSDNDDERLRAVEWQPSFSFTEQIISIRHAAICLSPRWYSMRIEILRYSVLIVVRYARIKVTPNIVHHSIWLKSFRVCVATKRIHVQVIAWIKGVQSHTNIRTHAHAYKYRTSHHNSENTHTERIMPIMGRRLYNISLSKFSTRCACGSHKSCASTRSHRVRCVGRVRSGIPPLWRW